MVTTGEDQRDNKAEPCRSGLVLRQRAGLSTKGRAVVRVGNVDTVNSTLTHDCSVKHLEIVAFPKWADCSKLHRCERKSKSKLGPFWKIQVRILLARRAIQKGSRVQELEASTPLHHTWQLTRCHNHPHPCRRHDSEGSPAQIAQKRRVHALTHYFGATGQEDDK